MDNDCGSVVLHKEWMEIIQPVVNGKQMPNLMLPLGKIYISGCKFMPERRHGYLNDCRLALLSMAIPAIWYAVLYLLVCPA